MNRIYERNGILFYYNNPAGYTEEGRAVIDSLFVRDELLSFLTGYEIEVKEGVYDRLAEGRWDMDVETSVFLSIRIYQLKPDSDLLMRFISLKERSSRGFGMPHILEYEPVYEGKSGTGDLESIWSRFQIQLPKGFKGHPLSISDVIEVYDSKERHFYYIDRTGFIEIGFL